MVVVVRGCRAVPVFSARIPRCRGERGKAVASGSLGTAGLPAQPLLSGTQRGFGRGSHGHGEEEGGLVS